MVFSVSLDSKNKSPSERSKGARGGASWFGREVALTISQDAAAHLYTQRNKFFMAASKPSCEPSFTEYGFKGHSLVTDSGAFLRTAGTLPFEPWASSPFFPDAPNSVSCAVTGYTTATHAPLGVYSMCQTVKGIKRLSEIGDKKGVKLASLDLGNTIAQTGLGIGYMGFRTATIGSVIYPNNPAWANASLLGGTIGGISGTLLYAGVAVSDLCSIDHSFGKKYQEKGGVEYMRRRLGVDPYALEEKALKEKTPEDLEKAGVEHLKSFAKTNMGLLRKHGFDPGVQSEEEFIDVFLSKREIREAGKEALIGRLREKKNAKISRAIGDEGVRSLTKLFSGGREVENSEVDKIVLAGLDTTNSSHYFKIGVYGAGTIAMLLLCIFSSGTRLLVASVLYAAVALAEVIIGGHAFNSQKNMHDVAPGKHEELISYLGVGGTIVGIGVQIAIASALSMGIAPIALGICLGLIYLGLYAYHLFTIDERREQYSLYLMNEKKGNLSLEEFKYICTYLSDKEFVRNSPLEHLNKRDRIAIEKYMQNCDKTWRESLLHAVTQRQEALEKEYVDEFWSEYQRYLIT